MSMLKINKVSMSGFKNHVEMVEFNLSDFTKIKGDNGKGKTTIGESISWAFLGTNLFGNEKADSTLVNKDTKVTEVEVNFTTESGDYEIVRRRKGSKTDIYLDGEKVTNVEVRQLFGEKDIFLTIFNPEYFPSKSPKDAKEFLNQILPKVKNEEVFLEMGEYEKDLLMNNNFKNPNLFLEDKRAELKEIEEDLIYIDGFIAGKKIEVEVQEEKKFDNIKLEKLKLELEKLENIKPLHDMEEVRSKKNEIEKEIFKLKNSKDEVDIRDIENQILQLQMEKQYPKIERPDLIDVKVLEGKKDLLLSEYNNLKEQLLNLDNSIKCSKCGNEIDLDKERKETLNNNKKEVQVKGVALKTEIEKAVEFNEEVNKKYEQDLKDYKDNVEKNIKALEKELKEKIVEIAKQKKEKVNKIIELKKEIETLGIESLEIENKDNEAKYKLKKVEIKEEIKQLEQEEYEVKLNNATRLKALKDIENSKKEIEKLKEEAILQEERKDEIKQQIDAAKLFNSTKLDIQTENIEKHLDKVSIKLQDLVKSTGELKDTFKIMYDNREFNVLSASEKIKAGLEIANLVMNVLDIKLPIFIDNAESITKYNKPDTQIIEARVVEGKELTVEA